MRAEWQRRIIAVGTALTVARVTHELEPQLAPMFGIPGVWITGFFSIVTLVWCFKLADMIPDPFWQISRRSCGLSIQTAVFALIALIWITVFAGISGSAH